MNVVRFPVEAISITDAPMIHRNGESWRWHSMVRNHFNLWICLEGRGEFAIGGRKYPISPWTAFLFPPHLEVFGSGGERGREIVNFTLHWTPEESGILENPNGLFGVRLREIDSAQTLVRILVRQTVITDELAAQQSTWAGLSLLALVWREFHLPLESPPEGRIRAQIETLLGGESLFANTSDLAAAVGLSRAHYSRCFKRITGLPPNRFLVEQRMRRACNLLTERNWTLEAIAAELGYSDVYFFSRQFKQVVGRSPGSYRCGSEREQS